MLILHRSLWPSLSSQLDHGTRPFIVEDRLLNIDGSLDRLNACDHDPKLFKRMFRIDEWCECFELTRWDDSFLPTPFSTNEITNLIFNLYFLYYLKHIDVYTLYALSSQISNLLRPCLKSKISYQVDLDDTKHRFLHQGTSPHVNYFYNLDSQVAFQQLSTLSYHSHPSLLLQKLPPTRPRQRPNSNLNRGIHLLYTCNPSFFIFKVYIYSNVVDCYFYSYETLIEFAKSLFLPEKQTSI